MRIPVTADDPRLGPYRALRDPDLRREGGLFIAEGRLVVRRLLGEGRFEADSLLLSPAADAGLADLTAARPDLPVYILPAAAFEVVTGFNLHRGCLAAARRGQAAAWGTLVTPPGGVVIGLEGLADADNVGSVFRHAAGFGARAVLLDEATVDPLYRKAIRTSMGAALRVPFARVPGWPAVAAALAADGWAVVALTPAPEAPPLREVARAATGPIVLLLGHEGDGLSAATLAACTHRARIPMAPGADSLNVAAAGAIALYEVTQARA